MVMTIRGSFGSSRSPFACMGADVVRVVVRIGLADERESYFGAT
jgi:hypothetical protein